MGTLASRPARRPPDPTAVAQRRIPRPADPIRSRCELDTAELRQIERAATACELSVASFIRVALVLACQHQPTPEQVAAWQAVADRLMAAETGRPKPGRQPGKKSKPDAGA